MKKLLLLLMLFGFMTANAQNDSIAYANLRLHFDDNIPVNGCHCGICENERKKLDIKTVAVDDEECKEYDLQGREVTQNTIYGIVIRNGKKYLRK